MPYLKESRERPGDIGVLCSWHVQAKLRFQLHQTKGRAIKKAALDTVRNLHLSEVWKSVETAIGESDLIRRERKAPPP